MQLRGEVTPHIGRHAFAVLAILKGMLLETLQKVFGTAIYKVYCALFRSSIFLF